MKTKRWELTNFGKRFEQQRRRVRKSKAQIARAIGYKPQQIAHYCYGKTKLTIDMAERLALELECSAAWLAFGDDLSPMNKDEQTFVNLYRELAPGQRGSVAAIMLDGFRSSPDGSLAQAPHEFWSRALPLQELEDISNGLELLKAALTVVPSPAHETRVTDLATRLTRSLSLRKSELSGQRAVTQTGKGG